MGRRLFEYGVHDCLGDRCAELAASDVGVGDVHVLGIDEDGHVNGGGSVILLGVGDEPRVGPFVAYVDAVLGCAGLPADPSPWGCGLRFAVPSRTVCSIMAYTFFAVSSETAWP